MVEIKEFFLTVNFSEMIFQRSCLDTSLFFLPLKKKKGLFSKSCDHPDYYFLVITPIFGYKENFKQTNQKKPKQKQTNNPPVVWGRESTLHKIFPDFICIWNKMGIGPCQKREAKYGCSDWLMKKFFGAPGLCAHYRCTPIPFWS